MISIGSIYQNRDVSRRSKSPPCLAMRAMRGFCRPYGARSLLLSLPGTYVPGFSMPPLSGWDPLRGCCAQAVWGGPQRLKPGLRGRLIGTTGSGALPGLALLGPALPASLSRFSRDSSLRPGMTALFGREVSHVRFVNSSATDGLCPSGQPGAAVPT
jgi:hypothetical protein